MIGHGDGSGDMHISLYENRGGGKVDVGEWLMRAAVGDGITAARSNSREKRHGAALELAIPSQGVD